MKEAKEDFVGLLKDLWTFLRRAGREASQLTRTLIAIMFTVSLVIAFPALYPLMHIADQVRWEELTKEN
ncbi:MAG: hypothetical protein KatS3mg022_3585 [Armatimonadota bacterium]|nr:MAG: hypothetical protein KatS3mg022_3585 [Armatimonadota bacterium]GIV20497.1 MAG: hypothetical protein KatS3mg023_2248 [Armatimonadota bacterium]GIV22101.1 MAG: hypothetical protein KatS3mg023_3852 [Armatimonadota bacterium]